MPTTKLKWYSPFVLLAGAILSVADQFTDILTLVEFRRGDQKTWFVVGSIIVSFQISVVPLTTCIFCGFAPPWGVKKKCLKNLKTSYC